MMASRCLFAMVAGLVFTALADAQALGQFEAASDIGTVLHVGSATYDNATKQYTVTGSGENMWWATDAFHFVWVKVSGDVSIAASATFPQPGGDNHRKAALMIRQSLDADAAYVDASLHGDGLTSLQTRSAKGANTWEIQAPIRAPVRYQLTKIGDEFYLSVAAEGETLHPAGGAVKLALTEPFYIGLAVCAHNKDDVQTAVFRDVVLTRGASKAKPVEYSTIESVPVPAGDRRAHYTAPGVIDEVSLVAATGVLRFRAGRGYMLEPGRTPVALPARMQVGSRDAHQFVIGPDIFRGSRAMNPVQLTKSQGRNADPTQEQDTEGFLYFASDRTGAWQIWKMKLDGTGQTQVTTDEVSAYAPRLSPDKTRLVYLASTKSDKPLAEDADVELRTVSLVDGKTNTLARFVGGPDSLGPNCWTEDSKRVVYVSRQRFAVPAKAAGK